MPPVKVLAAIGTKLPEPILVNTTGVAPLSAMTELMARSLRCRRSRQTRRCRWVEIPAGNFRCVLLPYFLPAGWPPEAIVSVLP